MKRTEDSLRDPWDNIRHTNFWIIGVPEEEKKKGYEKIFEEVIVWKFPQDGKGNSQSSPRVTYRINPRRNMPRRTVIKLTKTKHNENIKHSQGEATSNIQGKSHMLNSWSFSRNSVGKKGNGRIYLKYWKGKVYNQDYSTWQGSHSKLMEK